jgi:hypothetical protein
MKEKGDDCIERRMVSHDKVDMVTKQNRATFFRTVTKKTMLLEMYEPNSTEVVFMLLKPHCFGSCFYVRHQEKDLRLARLDYVFLSSFYLMTGVEPSSETL